MKTQLIIGIGCLIVSLGASAADQQGGLEQIIDGMEHNGITHDMQMGDEQETDATDDDSAPVPQPGSAPGTTAAQAPQRHQDAVAQAADSAHQPPAQHRPAAGVVTSTWQHITHIAKRHTPITLGANPLREQAPASGGLEQIIDRMQTDVASPMRVGQAPNPPELGKDRDAYLNEHLAN